LALVTLAGAAGLFRVFSSNRWIGSVLLTVLAVHGLCWLLRRYGVGQLAAVPAVVAGIGLMAAWTVLGRFTEDGLPTGRTWDQAIAALRDLGREIASTVAPVAPTRTFQLLAVGGAGVAAALADWAAFRWRTPMVALMPGLAVFIFCCTMGVGGGRGVTVGFEVAAVCAFLLAERGGGEGQVWFAGRSDGVAAWVVATGGVVALAAVIAAVGLTPAFGPRDGTGVLGWRSGFGPNGGERIVPNPLVDFRTRLTQYANTPVFVVSSSVPSYWRLTSLDTFDGTTWVSSGSYSGFGTRLPGTAPAAARTARATFTVQSLDSVWLPAQFDPISVEGVRHVTYDPASDSLLTTQGTSDRMQYSVNSYQYLDTLSASALEAAPPVSSGPTVGRDLQLPASVGGPITQLADTLTRGLTTEYAKALAIQNWLRSPQFTYSLDPPSDGAGDAAIYNFLFVTRTGYCQQFAGAFAVLARAAHLPTRLAVGFATGQAAGAGTFQVRDKDSHTWPEVYFGPKYGWVPFEPTKGFDMPGTGGYSPTTGSSTGPGSVQPVAPSTTVAGSTSPASGNTPKNPKAAVTTAPPAVAAPVRHSGGASPWWLLLPGAVLAWPAVNGSVSVLRRGRRRRRAAHAGTQAVVLNSWEEVTSALLWFGIRRQPDETDDEFARRASTALRRIGVDAEWTYGGFDGMATMARRAAFAASVPDGLGEQAQVAAAEIGRRLAGLSSRRRRASRLWSLPPGTGRRLLEMLRFGVR
jgi:transglutaminase-like putative cysteine protease